MTEEIIIDGVNVAGCIYYKQECIANCGMFALGDFKCEGQICLYKQLKRLEQENRELKAYKDINEDFKKAWDELNKKYTEVLKLAKENADCNEYCLQELEKENRELKEEIQFHNKENSNFLAERNAAQIGYDEIREIRERYRSALEEILESAKFAQCLPCGSGNLEDCLNCDDDTTNNGQFCMEKRIHEIKTKCVEVLSE